LKEVEAAGKKLRVELVMGTARTVEEFDGAFATMTENE
jgi:hypothetical protein